MTRTTRPLQVDELRSALGSSWPCVDVVERTGSTNADLLAAARAGAPDRTVLVAEHQDAGRDRLARTWVSPPGSGITVSVLLRPVGVPASRFGWLPLLTGLALLDAVRELTGVPVGLKWPNDLLVGVEPRKVAGILAEVADPQVPSVVVGVGINVAGSPPEQPTATSLAAEGADLDRTTLLVAFLRHLDAREERWREQRGNAEQLRADYRAGCASLGAQVRVELPGGTAITGTAEDVDTDGRLLLLTESGSRRAVAAGDIVHLRPATDQ